MKLLAAALVLALVTPAVSAHGQVTSDYNKFDNYSEIQTPEVDLPDDISAKVSYTCGGEVEKCRPASIVLFLSEKSAEWEHLDDNEVVLLLNGHERFRLGAADHDGSIGDGYVLEFRNLELPLSLARRIASAQSVELQWSLTRITLTGALQSNLRLLLATIPAAHR